MLLESVLNFLFGYFEVWEVGKMLVDGRERFHPLSTGGDLLMLGEYLELRAEREISLRLEEMISGYLRKLCLAV